MKWLFGKIAKSFVAVLSAAALSTLPAFADPAAPAWPPASERTGPAVMAVEHEWLGALHHRDVKTLARILGREFIDSDFQGEAITRAQFLAYFAHPGPHSAPPRRQTFADTMVRFVADGNVAIVTGVVVTWASSTPKTVASNPPAIAHSRFTDVFVWRDARWQAVTGQETHFSPGSR